MKEWQLQDAKSRLSEVVRLAKTEGPQSITVHGKVAVVLISATEYSQLRKPKTTFIHFMQSAPLVGVELDLARDPSTTRDIDL